ncbi:MAG: ribonuclease III [Gammaproteobacteria bacterium]
MSRSYERLQELLGYQFSRRELLETALTHRSFAKANNERLEFLGDGVLNFVAAQLLYQRFPKADEGQLSRLRAHLVKGATLAAVARTFHLGDFLHLGPGERKSGGFRRDSILAGALEAVIGAVFLDGGFEQARGFINAIYRERLASLSLEQGSKDPKTRLQEFLQGRGLPLPEYRVLSAAGDAHNQLFQVECSVAAADIRTQGSGANRRAAEQGAALRALAALGDETEE